MKIQQQKIQLFITGVRNVFYISKRILMEDQVCLCHFFSYRRVWYSFGIVSDRRWRSNNKKSNFFITGVRNVLYVSKRTHMEDQVYLCQFFSYRRVWYSFGIMSDRRWRSNNKKSIFFITVVRNFLYVSKRTLMEDQICFCQFFSYRWVGYIKLYVFWETNPLVHSKLLMDDVCWIRNILIRSRR